MKFQLPLSIEMKIKFNNPAELHVLMTTERNESTGIHLAHWQPAICTAEYQESARYQAEKIGIELGQFHKFRVETSDEWSTVYIGENPEKVLTKWKIDKEHLDKRTEVFISFVHGDEEHNDLEVIVGDVKVTQRHGVKEKDLLKKSEKQDKK